MELIWKEKKGEIDSPLRRAEAIADSMGRQELKETVDFLQVMLKHNEPYDSPPVGTIEYQDGNLVWRPERRVR